MKEINGFQKLDALETEELKKQILSNKNLLNSTTTSGFSLLQIAIKNRNVDLALWLIHNGVDVNFRDGKGSTALHYCAAYNQYTIAKCILENGGWLNIEDKYGNEPLWTAVFNVRKDLSGLEILELFLKNGGDINHENNVNKSPLYLANDIAFEPTVKMMKKYA